MTNYTIMNLNRWVALFLFVLILILCVALEQILYSSGEKNLMMELDATFAEAIKEGLNEQYAALHIYENYDVKNPQKKHEHCVITDANGEKAEILTENNRRIVTSDINHKIHHTVLAKKGIKVDSLRSLWDKKLLEVKINSQQALRMHLYNANESIFMSGDSILFTAKHKKMSSIYAGVSNEIEMEPFIQYSWFSVIRHASIGMIVISEFILIIFLFIGIFYFLMKKIPKRPSKIYLANLQYVYDQNLFLVDGHQISVRPQSASLLLLFLQAPSYCVTKEEIISRLWRKEDKGVEDRVRRVISDLRTLFREELVEISIEPFEDTYRLVCKKAPFHR